MKTPPNYSGRDSIKRPNLPYFHDGTRRDGGAKTENINDRVFMCHWVKDNLVRPNHECESKCEILVDVYTSFSYLCFT